MDKFDRGVPPPSRYSNRGPVPKYPFHLLAEGESVWMDPADYGFLDIVNIRIAAHAHARRYGLRIRTQEERMDINGTLVRGIRVWNLGMDPDIKREREAAEKRARIAEYKHLMHVLGAADRIPADDEEIWRLLQAGPQKERAPE